MTADRRIPGEWKIVTVPAAAIRLGAYSEVTITGRNLANATQVSFNGTPATFAFPVVVRRLSVCSMDQGMRKFKSAGVILAALAGVLAFAGPAAASATAIAGTASASSNYTHSEIFRCAVYTEAGINPCFGLEVNTTSTSSQIWINGTVTCYPQQGDIAFTWCGVGGGNGTGTLNIGVNFTIGHVVTGLYERMNIYPSSRLQHVGQPDHRLVW